MMKVENRRISALLARPSYDAALRERLKMDRSALRGHPFRERLESLLAEVEHAYASPANHLTMPAQRRSEREELEEQYAPLFWHYLGRALRAADEVEFALMEARIRCLLREVQAQTGRPLSDGLKA
jgi:hypothetical protein